MCIWNIFSEDISISYLPHVVNTCVINVIMAYALSTHQNRLSETALVLARRLRAKFWPDCAIPDTSMKFGTVVDHD